LFGDVCKKFVTTAKIATVLVTKPVPHESQNYTPHNLSKLYGLETNVVLMRPSFTNAENFKNFMA
jgi:hypothetical protein